MEVDQLKLLEERINNAIAFIEKLKTREKVLNREKEELNTKITALKKVVESKDKRIEELLDVQRFLKEKIETILNKLESFADIGSAYELEEKKTEEEIIIDENIVDLKKEKEKAPQLEDDNVNDQFFEKSEDDKQGYVDNDEEKNTDMPSEEHDDTLFGVQEDKVKGSLFQPDNRLNLKGNLEHNLDKGWFESNPFIET